MKVNSIELNNFRNISSIALEADSGVNVIYGENAQGKTNIIEGIWLFTGCKSFRGSKDAELIKFGEVFSKLKMNFENSTREKQGEILIADKKRSFTLTLGQEVTTHEIVNTLLADKRTAESAIHKRVAQRYEYGNHTYQTKFLR